MVMPDQFEESESLGKIERWLDGGLGIRRGLRRLTGGTVGPEASVICPLVLAVVAILFSLRHREAPYQAEET
jgi:hypothetical protein